MLQKSTATIFGTLFEEHWLNRFVKVSYVLNVSAFSSDGKSASLFIQWFIKKNCIPCCSLPFMSHVLSFQLVWIHKEKREGNSNKHLKYQPAVRMWHEQIGSYLFKMVVRIEYSIRTARRGTAFHTISMCKKYNASIGVNERLHRGPFSNYWGCWVWFVGISVEVGFINGIVKIGKCPTRYLKLDDQNLNRYWIMLDVQIDNMLVPDVSIIRKKYRE